MWNQKMPTVRVDNMKTALTPFSYSIQIRISSNT